MPTLPTRCLHPQARRRAVVSAFVLAAVLSAGHARAQNPNDKLCFRNYTGVPYLYQPPTIDGIVREGTLNGNPVKELGWTNAFRYIANPAGTADSVDVAMQGILGQNNLDLSFEIKNDPRLDDTDAIVLGFASAGQYVRIVVYPFSGIGGTASYSGPVKSIERRFGTLGAGGCVQWGDADFNPSGLVGAVTTGFDGTSYTWNLELQIQLYVPDLSGLMLNPSGFAFFAGVVRIYDQNNELGNPFAWPNAAQIGACEVNGAAYTLTPPTSQWGTGSLNTGNCGGVSFQYSDIKTNQPSPSQISKVSPNRFSVTLHNNTIDTRPGPNLNKPVAAQQVRARFRIANFGLPSNLSWTDIPGGNSLAGPQDIPAATTSPPNSAVPPGSIMTEGTATLETPAPGWIPDPAWTSVNSGHQCILVELDSSSSNTTFVNRSTWRNMNYTSNPGGPAAASISAQGYGTPPGGQANQVFDLLVKSAPRYAYGDGTVADIPLGRLTAQLTLTLNGYRMTGRRATLNAGTPREPKNIRYTLVDPVGYFGYVVQHALDELFETAYNQRHANAIGECTRTTDSGRVTNWSCVNRLLANDKERPSISEWGVSVPGLQVVPLTGRGTRVRIAVANNTVRTLQPAIRYSRARCLCFLCCNNIPLPTTANGMLIVGLLAWRLRRRRDA